MTAAGLSTLYRVLSLQSRRKTGGGGSFSPTDITGLQLWIDFSDISTLYQDSSKTTPVASDGDVIGCVADKSGNGNDLTQGTTIEKPLYKTGIQNSLSAALFDGSNDELEHTTLAINQPTTIVHTGHSTETDAVLNFIVDGRTATYRQYIAHDNRAGNIRDLIGADTGVAVAGNTMGQDVLFVTIFNGASSKLYRNNSLDISGNAGSENIQDGIVVGNSYDGSWEFKGYFYEFLIYSGVMSDSDRASLQTYLNNKWSIY